MPSETMWHTFFNPRETLLALGLRSDNRLRVATRESCRLVACCDYGRRIAVTDGTHIEVPFPPGQHYLRVECWGPGEQFAWTQPVFLPE